jgi:hypothetical protein
MPLLLALLLALLATGSLTSFKGARSDAKLEVDAPLSLTVAQPPSPAVPALRSSPCVVQVQLYVICNKSAVVVRSAMMLSCSRSCESDACSC